MVIVKRERDRMLSKLYEHTSVMITTSLTFGEWDRSAVVARGR